MRKVLLYIAIFTFVTAQLQAQDGRHGKGYKAIELSYGINPVSSIVGLGYVSHIKRTLSFDNYLFYDRGNTSTQLIDIVYYSSGVSFMTLSNPGKSVFLTTGGGLLLGGDKRESKIFEGKTIFKFCYGLNLQAKSEIYFSSTLSMVLTAQHRIQFTGGLKAQNISNVMIGVRYNY